MNRAIQASEPDSAKVIDLSSFKAFKASFPLQGEALYLGVFEAHADIVQTQKAKFAVANLAKIFDATFAISAASGFDKMSLRDLSQRTGMSMGAIYSCITRKEDIVRMVAHVVRKSSELTHRYSLQEVTHWRQIEQGIRFHLYASSLLQRWYFLLYFETRSLPEVQQQESKQIELDAIDWFTTQINAGVASGEFETEQPDMVANTVVVLLEDWYLKPWKNKTTSRVGSAQHPSEDSINAYHTNLCELVSKLLIRR